MAAAVHLVVNSQEPVSNGEIGVRAGAGVGRLGCAGWDEMGEVGRGDLERSDAVTEGDAVPWA